MDNKINQIYISCDDKEKYSVCIERAKGERWYSVSKDNVFILSCITRIGNYNKSFKYWIHLGVFPTIHIDRIMQ